MEAEMRRGEKRKAVAEQVEELKTKRPKMPSDGSQVNYGDGYVKKHGKENKWRIVFPAKARGGGFERTRQWASGKAKKAQWISALELIEEHMLEVADKE